MKEETKKGKTFVGLLEIHQNFPVYKLHNKLACISCNMGRKDLPDICMPEARGPQARGLRAYILDKS